MFLHLVLWCPSSCDCIPYAITKCRMTILISYLPCLPAQFLLREDCLIRPLAPLVAYLRIWNSLIRQNVWSLIRWFFSVCSHFDQKGSVPTAILFHSISLAATRMFASGVPTNVAFPPSPIHLLNVSTMTGCHTPIECSNGSSTSVSRSASKDTTNSGRFLTFNFALLLFLFCVHPVIVFSPFQSRLTCIFSF